MRLILFLLIFIHLLFTKSEFSCEEDKGDIDYESYKGIEIILRETYNTNRRVYTYIDGYEFSYIHKESRLFPVLKPEKVLIKKVEAKDDFIRVEFKSDYLGKGEIDFFGPTHLIFQERYFGQLFNIAFDITEATSSRTQQEPVYLGHRGSHLLHLKGCNHIPSKDYLVLFTNPDDATNKGYSKCQICFIVAPDVVDYLVEKRLSQEIAALVRYYYPLVVKPELHELTNRVGKKVLSDWPEPLKGYSYSFQAVEGDEPNAIACPGGKIYITTCLLNSVDSEEELESIFAHEIAHIEKRHGYHQFNKARSAAQWGMVAAAMTGAIVTAKGGSVEETHLAVEIANLFSSLATAIVLSGYSREYEEEADSYALYYFANSERTSGRSSFINVLKKLKYYEDSQGAFDRRSGIFSYHPGIDDRISIAKDSKVKVFDPPLRFIGLDKDGEEVAMIKLDMQRFVPEKSRPPMIGNWYRKPDKKTTSGYDYSLTIFGTLFATSLLEKSTEIKHMIIRTSDGIVRLENEQRTEILPNGMVGATFIKRGDVNLIEKEITGITLPLPNVVDWIKVDHLRY